MVQKTKGQSTESDTYTYEERLSQPTVEEYQTADAWPPMQDHGYAYYSDHDWLAQDIPQERKYPSSRYLQMQLGTCNKPLF